MQQNNCQFLTIIGNVASGKSTAMPILLEALEAHPLYADDLFQTVDPFKNTYLENTKRWAFTNELWLTFERAKMIREYVQNKDVSLVLVDSGLLMSWVYTYSHLLVENITLEEWEFYEKLYDEFANGYLEKSVVVVLKYSMNTLMKRLKMRARDYELEYYNQEYLEQIEQGIEALEKKLANQRVQLIAIDEVDVADFEKSSDDSNKLIETVRQHLKENINM